ncbi:MAG: ATP-binding protein [Burkholderiaceae bacterium]
MALPDLSFLLQAQPPDSIPEGQYLPLQAQASAPAPDEVPLPALIAELRAYQMELEAQNKVLQYSQLSAERASERFEALFASVPLSLMVLDEYDMVVQANAMAHRSFQPTERDRPLTALTPFVSPNDVERVRLAFAQARERGQAVATEVVFAQGDQVRITGDLHIAFITLGHEGETPQHQYLCAVIDQGPLLAERSALQERNEQLRASEKRLEAVINSALDAIVCVDQHQRITVFNPTAAVLFQCSASDALGSTLDRFLPDAARALGFGQMTTQAVLGEMTARTATGKELAVEVSVSFEHHADGLTTTVFARDLTSRKRAEAQRNELEAQLRESHKMQAVGTMAGGIAHDFNNILSAILGNVELAMADCAPESSAMVSLREIQKAGRRARDLVRQILTFSRNEPPRLGAVDLVEVLQDTERLLRVTLPPTVALQIHIAPHLPTVRADATQVEQALVNLCTNAIHAIGARKGTVRVHAQPLRPDRLVCDRLGLAVGDYVAISVQDDGPGMDAATLQRIFEPFFTTKPVGQGTGLGLAVVHGVMRTHGGAVDVQSTPGAGSRFTLYFPLAAEAPSAADEASATAQPPVAPPAPDAVAPAQRPRVVYVDDDEALTFLVQRVLHRRGYEVTVFNDPHAAVAALRQNPQRADLLVTDYNMPGYSGVELLRDVVALRADLPVALASGYVTPDIEQAALAAGAHALIHKPNDVDELCATVAALLQVARG